MDKTNHSATSSFLSRKSPAAKVFLVSLLALIIIVPFDEGGNNFIGQGIAQIVLLGCLAVWVTQTLRRRSITLIVDWIDLCVLGFLGWSCLSLFVADYYYTAFLEFVKIVSYLAIFYLCRTLFPLYSIRTLLLWTIFGSSVFQMFLGWYWYLSHYTPVLQADFVNPNNFACFLSFGVNIGLSFLLFATRPEHHSSRTLSRFLPQLLIGLFLCCLTATIFVEQSRGAVLSLMGTGFFLITIKKRQIGMFSLILFCVLLLVPLPGGNMFTRLQKRGDQYAYERIGIWESSIRMAADYPLWGVGLGMYKYYGHSYNFPVEHAIARYGKHLNIAHNDVLQIAVELGIIGALLFVGGAICLGSSCLVQLRQRPPCWRMMAACTGILGLLIQGLFSNRLLSPALAIITAIFSAIVFEGARRFFTRSISFNASWLWHLVTFSICAVIFLYGIAYPFLGHVAYLRYNTLMKERHVLEAIRQLQTAIAYVPQHPNYHYQLAMIYQKAYRKRPTDESFQKAEKSFTEAIRYNPHNYRYYESLARLYEKKFYSPPREEEAARAALTAYQHAHDVHPYSPFLLFAMATLHADLDEFAQALELLRTSVTLEPNFVGGHQMLGKMLAHLERQDEAEAAFRLAENIMRQYNDLTPDSNYVASLLRPLFPSWEGNTRE